MLLALLAAELLGTMQAKSQAVGRLGKLNGEAKYWYGRVVKGKKPRFDSSFHKTIEAIAKRRSGAPAAEANWQSFLDFLRILCEHLPSGYQTVIQTISFRQEKATIRGEAQDVTSFEELARSLEKSGKFDIRTPFRMRSGRRDGPARLAFTIELSPRSK
jgi:hypothetical protein